MAASVKSTDLVRLQDYFHCIAYIQFNFNSLIAIKAQTAGKLCGEAVVVQMQLIPLKTSL